MEWANPACQGSILHISSINSSDWQFDHLTGGLQVSLMTPQWLLWLRALLASQPTARVSHYCHAGSIPSSSPF